MKKERMVASSGSSAISSSPALQSTTEGSSKPPATVLSRFSTVQSKLCGAASSSNRTWLDATPRCRSIIGSSIGLASFDVIIEANDIYGDGVNIASRLENMADPGQVYISGGIYEQIKNKLVCGYESLGDRKVKNITDPVRVYRVLPDPAAFNRTRKGREKILLFLLSIALLIISGGALWYLLWQPHDKTRDQASVLMPKAPQSPSARSAIPTKQQPVLQPPPASPAAPGAAPTMQLASAAREPEMNALRGASYTMGSNDDITERPTHQVRIKPFSISKYPITVREWNHCSDAKAGALAATE